MSTLYLRPNAAGDETNLPNQTPDSGAHWDKVDEETPDGDSTYVWSSADAVWYRDLYNLGDTSQTGVINWIKVWVVCAASIGGYAKTGIKTGGTAYDGSEITLTNSFVSYSTQYTTNPQAGGAWTWTQLNALQAGVSMEGDGAKGCGLCTQVYIEVDYTPVVGRSYGFIIG